MCTLKLFRLTATLIPTTMPAKYTLKCNREADKLNTQKSKNKDKYTKMAIKKPGEKTAWQKPNYAKHLIDKKKTADTFDNGLPS